MTVFARDIFLFTVYTKGMRERRHLPPDKLEYQERTAHLPPARHRQGISLPWELAMQEIADRYMRKGSPLLFPVITAKSPHEQWIQYDGILHRINYNLKKLGEKDRTRLSAEPHRCKAFVGKHDQERKHKRPVVTILHFLPG